jgi:hypothetical protein
MSNQNESITCPITYEDIDKAVKILKNNKACGLDRRINEQINAHIV